MLQGDKVNYVVEINELSHKTGTREVIESKFTNLTTEMTSENIQNLGNIVQVIIWWVSLHLWHAVLPGH